MTTSYLFEQIATKENGDFKQIDKKVSAGHGSSIFMGNYLLNFTYRDTNIYIEYDLGHYNIANTKCVLPLSEIDYDLRISTRSRLNQIFNPKKNSLIVKTTKFHLQKVIEFDNDFIKLSEIAKNYSFEPELKLIESPNGIIIDFKYSLVFYSINEVLEPSINFLKTLIDYYLEH